MNLITRLLARQTCATNWRSCSIQRQTLSSTTTWGLTSDLLAPNACHFDVRNQTFSSRSRSSSSSDSFNSAGFQEGSCLIPQNSQHVWRTTTTHASVFRGFMTEDPGARKQPTGVSSSSQGVLYYSSPPNRGMDGLPQHQEQPVGIQLPSGHRTCLLTGCMKQPSCNFEGERRGLYCSPHRQLGMVNVTGRKCAYDGCRLQPAFNLKGESRGRFCSAHQQPGMVDVITKRCAADGCNVRPVFNMEGEPVGLYCASHKQPGMVDVMSKRCQHKDCSKIPVFNLEGSPRGIACKLHKQPGMVNVCIKPCEHDGCSIKPSFNTEGLSRGRFCSLHRLHGMVDVCSKRCAHTGCKERAGYGFEGMTGTVFCKIHKQPGMMYDSARRRSGVPKKSRLSVNPQSSVLPMRDNTHLR